MVRPLSSPQLLRLNSLLAAVALATALPLAAQQRQISVQSGDTLEQLAVRYGVSQEALIQLNGLQDPNQLQVGQRLLLPAATAAPSRPAPAAASALEAPAPPAGSQAPAAALLLSPGERRDRAALALREQAGLVRWKWFNATAVDWAGWTLHSGGVRITLVKAAAADLGLRGAAATAVAVQCESLRQTWRIEGNWQPWEAPLPGSVGQRIVLDLCSNTLDSPAVPVPPPPAP
jgi:LysM repeat protein